MSSNENWNSNKKKTSDSTCNYFILTLSMEYTNLTLAKFYHIFQCSGHICMTKMDNFIRQPQKLKWPKNEYGLTLFSTWGGGTKSLLAPYRPDSSKNEWHTCQWSVNTILSITVTWKKNYETYYRSARVQVWSILKYLLTILNNFLCLSPSILLSLG